MEKNNAHLIIISLKGRNNNFIERKEFTRHYQRNSWMDLSELQSIYSLHIEGTNIFVMGGLV